MAWTDGDDPYPLPALLSAYRTPALAAASADCAGTPGRESVPDRRPARRSRRVPRDRADWIPISCPRIVTDEVFEPLDGSRSTTPGAPRRAEPGSGCEGLVKCGACGVGTNCHKMRGRNGSWHRYYYCRNHDPLRAGGQDRRCPERNIRADALDEFVFDQIKQALLQPDLHLTANTPSPSPPGPRGPAARRRTHRLDRKVEAARRRSGGWSTSTKPD